jgi:hypothetical protein
MPFSVKFNLKFERDAKNIKHCSSATDLEEANEVLIRTM